METLGPSDVRSEHVSPPRFPKFIGFQVKPSSELNTSQSGGPDTLQSDISSSSKNILIGENPESGSNRNGTARDLVKGTVSPTENLDKYKFSLNLDKTYQPKENGNPEPTVRAQPARVHDETGVKPTSSSSPRFLEMSPFELKVFTGNSPSPDVPSSPYGYDTWPGSLETYERELKSHRKDNFVPPSTDRSIVKTEEASPTTNMDRSLSMTTDVSSFEYFKIPPKALPTDFTNHIQNGRNETNDQVGAFHEENHLINGNESPDKASVKVTEPRFVAANSLPQNVSGVAQSREYVYAEKIYLTDASSDFEEDSLEVNKKPLVEFEDESSVFKQKHSAQASSVTIVEVKDVTVMPHTKGSSLIDSNGLTVVGPQTDSEDSDEDFRPKPIPRASKEGQEDTLDEGFLKWLQDHGFRAVDNNFRQGDKPLKRTKEYSSWEYVFEDDSNISETNLFSSNSLVRTSSLDRFDSRNSSLRNSRKGHRTNNDKANTFDGFTDRSPYTGDDIKDVYTAALSLLDDDIPEQGGLFAPMYFYSLENNEPVTSTQGEGILIPQTLKEKHADSHEHDIDKIEQAEDTIRPISVDGGSDDLLRPAFILDAYDGESAISESDLEVSAAMEKYPEASLVYISTANDPKADQFNASPTESFSESMPAEFAQSTNHEQSSGEILKTEDDFDDVFINKKIDTQPAKAAIVADIAEDSRKKVIGSSSSEDEDSYEEKFTSIIEGTALAKTNSCPNNLSELMSDDSDGFSDIPLPSPRPPLRSESDYKKSRKSESPDSIKILRRSREIEDLSSLPLNDVLPPPSPIMNDELESLPGTPYLTVEREVQTEIVSLRSRSCSPLSAGFSFPENPVCTCSERFRGYSSSPTLELKRPLSSSGNAKDSDIMKDVEGDKDIPTPAGAEHPERGIDAEVVQTEQPRPTGNRERPASVPLGRESLTVLCPHCQATVLTEIVRKPTRTYGCCVLPVCMDRMKEVEHWCPQCKALIGKYP